MARAAMFLIFLAFGGALLGSLFMVEVPLFVNGITTTGTIEKVERLRTRSRELTVGFTVEGGQKVHVRIHESVISSYSVGEQVRLAYVPGDPDAAEILTFSQLGISLLTKILLGGVGVAIACVAVRK